MSELRNEYNLYQPPDLIARQVMLDLEIIAMESGLMIKFGERSHACVERLVLQYQEKLLAEQQASPAGALRERVDRLAEENEAQHHAIRELEATIEQAVSIFKDFAAHNDAESIGNPVLWNSVLSTLTGSDEPGAV